MRAMPASMRRNGRAGRKRPTHALSGSAGSSLVLRTITGRSAVGSAPALGAGCRVFKSPRSDQKNRNGKDFAEVSPSGKATVFDAVIRRFEPANLCHGRRVLFMDAAVVTIPPGRDPGHGHLLSPARLMRSGAVIHTLLFL